MNADAAKAVVKLIKGLFPQTTDEQGRLLFEKVRDFSKERSEAAVKTFAEKNEWLAIPALLSALRLDHEKAIARRKLLDKERVIDWLRKTQAMRFGPAAGLDDAVVLQLHFAECWKMVNESDANWEGREGMRHMMLGMASEAFRQIGYEDAQAVAAAEMCLDLAPGERPIKKLPSQLVMREIAPIQPKDQATELRKLASAELDAQTNGVLP